ncbi:MAG: tryptophanase [Candidatus Kariarchaeaceae archaeon]|jgi:tryptophanase
MTYYPPPPYKIKMVEPIVLIPEEDRLRAIKDAEYNLFNLKAQDIYLDFLTDSGTGAMTQTQWAAMMVADETYANALSYQRFEESVRTFTGMSEIIPTHQGRAAENILLGTLLVDKPGSWVVSNQSFDTTVGHILFNKAQPVDIVIKEGRDPNADHPFKGNMDTDKLKELLEESSEKIALITLVLTNNAGGGQPVAMENVQQVARLAREYGKPFYLDIARIAENAYFIQKRDPMYGDVELGSIIREICSYSDGVWMSAKKDAYVNIGGFIAVQDKNFADRMRERLILFEGFPTYGGMAGRDLEAIAKGLEEVVEGTTVEHRVAQVAYLVEELSSADIPVVMPPGGHAAFVDAGALLPHIPPHEFPAQALGVELYIEGGIRTVEIGSLMFGRHVEDQFVPATLELLRITIPRRVYTKAHMDYVVDVFRRLKARIHEIKGLKITEEPELLRHFTCKLAPIKSGSQKVSLE